jgi:hypothetical protein
LDGRSRSRVTNGVEAIKLGGVISAVGITFYRDDVKSSA